jgi:hypothetical protein
VIPLVRAICINCKSGRYKVSFSLVKLSDFIYIGSVAHSATKTGIQRFHPDQQARDDPQRTSRKSWAFLQ